MFPGVFLLSRCLLSGFPVDFAILFGPGLIPITIKDVNMKKVYILY